MTIARARDAARGLALLAVVSTFAMVACGGDPPADTDRWHVPHAQWPSCGYGPEALAYISTSGEIRVRTLDGLTDDLVIGARDLVARANVENGFVPDYLDFAPNRRWIAVQLHRIYPDNAALMVALSCDGQQLVKLGGLPVTVYMVIAPDSNQAAVRRTRGKEDTRPQGLFVIDTSAGTKRKVADSGLPAAWSEDGKTVYAVTFERETLESILVSVPSAGGPVTKLHQPLGRIMPCASRPLRGALYCGYTSLTRFPLDGSPSEWLRGPDGGLEGTADVTDDGRLFGAAFGYLRAIDLDAKTDADVWPGRGPKMQTFAF